MGLFLAAALVVLTQDTGPQIAIAVTRDGARVEAVSPQVGDLTLETPLGRLLTARDPVVEVVDGAAQLEAMRGLRADGTLDDVALLRDLSTAGQLSAMLALAEELHARDPGMLLPYEVLESWAARVDPVPRSVDRNDRVAWLWMRVKKADWPEAVVAGWRLLEEVSAGSNVSNDRILLLSDLRDGLDDRRPWVRRAAARVAGRQQEVGMRERILPLSLEDPNPASRDGAAWGAREIHPWGARQYWARNVLRNVGGLRESAALNLGRYGGDEGARVLIHVLAAWDKRPPARFDFAGRRIWVVQEAERDAHRLASPSMADPRQDPHFPATPHSDLEREYIDLGTYVKVTRYGESLRVALLEALDLYAGQNTGRDAEAWLRWYLEERPADTP